MRFGIMAMQMAALVPSGLSRENALAHVAGFDHAALVRRLAAPGFNPIELGGDLVLFFPQAFAPAAVERLAALKAELGLSYTSTSRCGRWSRHRRWRPCGEGRRPR